MILTTIKSDEGPVGEPSWKLNSLPDRPITATPSSEIRTACRLEIDKIVTRITSSDVRGIVDVVFSDLLRLLECLTLVERYLRQADAADQTLALFQIIHDEAQLLVAFIREEGMNSPAMNEDLMDVLDGISFAVNHDLQRVFESEAQVNFTMNAHAVVGKLYRAHDVLTNCLQQSTITLAMVFNPQLVGTRLFNNSDMRYRQSLQLCKDLSDLLQIIPACETDYDEVAMARLSAGIQRFRDESLECLMYSDWPQFESFCGRIESAGSDHSNLDSVLHQFRCYVQTLLGQVRMRAVLANVSPFRHVVDQSPAPEFEAENELWIPSAVAM